MSAAKPLGASSVARIAGNILSGIAVSEGLHTDYEDADLALKLARYIAAEAERLEREDAEEAVRLTAELPGEQQWPDDDLRRAFVAGAAWWEFESKGATIWMSDRIKAEYEAQKRYPDGKPRPK